MALGELRVSWEAVGFFGLAVVPDVAEVFWLFGEWVNAALEDCVAGRRSVVSGFNPPFSGKFGLLLLMCLRLYKR